jgi:methanogenic corrinoid protein MtbC1
MVIQAPDAEITAVSAPPSLPAAPDSEALVMAAAAFDTAGLERALDQMFARGSYESVIDDVVLRAVAAVGEAWAASRIDVAAEHLASAAVHRRLAALFDQGGFAGAGRSVLVGLPPGSRHEIGLLAFAIALRRRRANVLYLGADVPISSWIPVTGDARVEVAVVGVPMSADIPAARQVVDALARARPELTVWLGGPAATKASGGGMRVLPFRVTDAAAEVAGLLGNG